MHNIIKTHQLFRLILEEYHMGCLPNKESGPNINIYLKMLKMKYIYLYKWSYLKAIYRKEIIKKNKKENCDVESNLYYLHMVLNKTDNVHNSLGT